MYHYLRHNGKTIVDIEPWISDGDFRFQGGIVGSNINVFLDLYDTIPLDKKSEFKKDFMEIGEARMDFYEHILPGEYNNVANDDNLWSTHEYLRSWLKSIAEKYGLEYGED